MTFAPIIMMTLAAGGMELGNAQVNDGNFLLLIRAPEEALQRSEIVPRGRKIVIFVPGVRASYSQSYRSGPVSSVRATSKARGTPIVVTLTSAVDATKRLSLVAGSPWRLQVVAAGAAKPQEAAQPAPVKTEPAKALFTPAKDVAKTRIGTKSGPSAGTYMTLAGLALLGLAVLIWLTKRRGMARVPSSLNSIEVVASRAFGGAHRLTLVETCGERLLLATSKTEVRVLSHLGAGEEVAPGLSSIVDPEAETDISHLAPELSAAESAESADVSGIIELRRSTGTQPWPRVVSDEGATA